MRGEVIDWSRIMSASATDRTVNKVALCSAIFAGAAYVGYSVVRQAFGRQLVPGSSLLQNRIDGRRGESVSQSIRKGKSFTLHVHVVSSMQ